MKLHEQEKVDGTGVTIGRRVQTRRERGRTFERVTATFTAVYKDIDGRWRQDSLGTANRREARRLAIDIQQRLDAGKSKPPPPPWS
jgi:hypothetical protein